MFFNISVAGNRSFIVESASADLAAFKAELATETVGYLTADGNQLIMIDVIRNSVITVAPSPPNPVVAPPPEELGDPPPEEEL
jgi:hypothetical protein